MSTSTRKVQPHKAAITTYRRTFFLSNSTPAFWDHSSTTRYKEIVRRDLKLPTYSCKWSNCFPKGSQGRKNRQRCHRPQHVRGGLGKEIWWGNQNACAENKKDAKCVSIRSLRSPPKLVSHKGVIKLLMPRVYWSYGVNTPLLVEWQPLWLGIHVYCPTMNKLE